MGTPPLYWGPCEKLYTPKTWCAVFLLATDTGGEDLSATKDRWRLLQVGNQASLFTNPVFYPLYWVWTPIRPLFGPLYNVSQFAYFRLPSRPCRNDLKPDDTLWYPIPLHPFPQPLQPLPLTYCNMLLHK